MGVLFGFFVDSKILGVFEGCFEVYIGVRSREVCGGKIVGLGVRRFRYEF